MFLSFPFTRKKSLFGKGLWIAALLSALCAAALVFAGCDQLWDSGSKDAQLDSDASLKSLTIDNGTLRPVFNSAIKDYSAVVANAVDTITVTGVPHSEKSSVSANSGKPQALNQGPNNIVITVTAEDGTAGTYTVTVERLDDSSIPIPIQSKEDLGKIGAESAYPLAGAYVLMKDLVLENWKPIGSGDYPFSGSFDGKGFAVTLRSFDAAVVSDYRHLGIFGYVKGAGSAKAEIKNLVVHSEISGTSTHTGGQAIGVLAGFAENTEFDNISLSGDFTFSTDKNTYFGGLVGYAQKGTAVTNSVNAMTITVDGGSGGGLISGMYYNYAGGLVGAFKDGVEIVDCRNTGNITAGCTTAQSQVFCGGITGGSYYAFTTEYQGKIENCSSTGTVHAKAMGFWTYAGGIAGTIVGDGDGSFGNTTRIVRCFVTGTVSTMGTSSGWPYTGGIVGYNYYGALIAQSYFTGTVIADKSGDYTGGIAGYNSKQPGHNSRIEDCWSSGTVTGFHNAGGIVGQNQVNTFVRRCYSIAAVEAANTGATGVGGIAGMNASTETDAITGCVALNLSIKAGNTAKIHRIAGSNAGTLKNNYAYSGMAVDPGSGTYTADKGADKVDGQDCDAKPAQSVYEGLGWDFTTVWKMGANGCPALRWQN